MKCFTIDPEHRLSEGILIEKNTCDYEYASLTRSPELPALVKVAGGVRIFLEDAQLMENNVELAANQMHLNAVVLMQAEFDFRVEGARCLWSESEKVKLIHMMHGQLVRIHKVTGIHSYDEPPTYILYFDGKQLSSLNLF